MTLLLFFGNASKAPTILDQRRDSRLGMVRSTWKGITHTEGLATGRESYICIRLVVGSGP